MATPPLKIYLVVCIIWLFIFIAICGGRTILPRSLIYTRKHRNYSAMVKKFLSPVFVRHNLCYLPANVGALVKDINIALGNKFIRPLF